MDWKIAWCLELKAFWSMLDDETEKQNLMKQKLFTSKWN